jgi:hypothetical protein
MPTQSTPCALGFMISTERFLFKIEIGLLLRASKWRAFSDGGVLEWDSVKSLAIR